MKRALPAVALVVLLLAALAFWSSRPSTPVPEPKPQPELAQPPIPPGRSVYHFTPPEPEAARPSEPVEPPAPPVPTTPSLPREVMNEFALASNEATGRMWKQCLRPWRDQNEVEDAPLSVNLVLQDGRVGDVELISPFPLPAELVTCMEDQIWSVSFPEHEPHRGTLRLQRTLSLTR